MRATSFGALVRAIFIVFATSLLGAYAYAQSGRPTPPPPPKLRFLFLDENAGHYALKIGKDLYHQVGANPYEISSPFTPLGREPLEIYKTSTRIDPETGKPLRLKIAVFTPPDNTPSALVVVTPRPAADAATPPVFKVEIIDTNPADFPGGSIRIVNRGNVSMGAQFGAEQIVTAPGETRVVRPQTDSRNRVFSKIAAQEPGGWKLLSDNITIVRPQNRIFGIFIFSPGGLRHTLTPAELAEFGPPPPGHFWLTFSDTP